MKPTAHTCVRPFGLAFLLPLLIVLTHATPANAFQIFQWKSAVSGSADIASNWNPSGVPGVLDYVMFNQPGGYQVVFPAAVASTYQHDYNGTGLNVTVTFTSPHTTSQFYVNGGTPTVTVNQGSLNANTVHVGQSGGNSALTLTAGSIIHSNSLFATNGGDEFGFDGLSNVTINGGAQYYCDHPNSSSQALILGVLPTAQTTTSIAGSTSPFPIRIYSGLHTTAGQRLIIGNQGVANLFAYNGGYVDASGTVMVGAAASSAGYVTIGPVSAFGLSSLTAHQDLWIGHNDFFTPSGHAELTVKNKGYVNVTGTCDVGSTANDAGCVLRVLQGGIVLTSGGLRFFPTVGNPFDQQGGIVHVHGGAFIWPSNKLLSVSSQVGTPELWIANGVANTGPSMAGPSTSGIIVGRGGTGTLRITGPGTVFNMTGAITLAESTTAVGKMVVDSSASVPFNGNLTVGSQGTGELDVLGGAHLDASYTVLAPSSAGAVGKLVVRGQSASDISRFTMRGDMYVGGGTSSQAGTGTVVVDSGASAVILPTGINPALVRIYSSSALVVSSDGLFRAAPGTIDNQGTISLDQGQIEATNNTILQTGAHLTGNGWVDLGTLINSGQVAPHSSLDAFGRIEMHSASYQQSAAGHYEVTLGPTLRCDTLQVHGPASLAGTLDLVLDPTFVWTPGDSFTVILADSGVTGTFSAVTWNGNPLTGQVLVVYQPKAVKVVIQSATTGVDPGNPSGATAELSLKAQGGFAAPIFRLDLPEVAEVEVALYDVGGRRAAVLFHGPLAAGEHRIGSNADAVGMSNGIYFARAIVRYGHRSFSLRARTILMR